MEFEDPAIAATIAQAHASLGGALDTVERHPESTVVPRNSNQLLRDQELVDVIRQAQGRGLELSDQLGAGGMGAVFAAVQPDLGRSVAVKRLRPESESDPAAQSQLLREAWAMGQLEHPHILPIYAIRIQDDGTPLIVMKRIEGWDWATYLHNPHQIRERFGATDPLEWNLKVLSRVAAAVAFAHERGLLHRDIKPENVMIGERDEVYLVDWGIALALDERHANRIPRTTDACELAGTPCYMAPEMLGGSAHLIGRETDVYLLGATLAEVLTGAPPHSGQSLQEMLGKVATSSPLHLPGAPSELIRIVHRAMARDPRARFENAGQFRLAIDGFLKHRGSMRLVDAADAALIELDESQASEQLDKMDEGETERQFTRRVDEARFAYKQALTSWADNPRAKEGLRRVTLRIAEHHLQQDRPFDAVAALRELEDPPVEVLQRAEAASKARASRSARRDRLERDHDSRVGVRTRMLVGSIIGLTWVAYPLAAHYYVIHKGLQRPDYFFLITTLIMGALFVGLAIWARETLRRTAVNRGVTRLVLTFVGLQFALGLTADGIGLDMLQIGQVSAFLWFVCASIYASALEPRFVPMAIAYGLGFAVAVWAPPWRFLAAAGAGVVVLANMWTVWGRQLARAMRDV